MKTKSVSVFCLFYLGEKGGSFGNTDSEDLQHTCTKLKNSRLSLNEYEIAHPSCSLALEYVVFCFPIPESNCPKRKNVLRCSGRRFKAAT